MKLLISLITVFALSNYVQAGCYLGHNVEDCKYRSFFDFGPNAGDENLTRQDDHHILIHKPSSFNFFGKYYQSFYISTNGVIKLVEKNETFSLHEQFHYNSEAFPIQNETLIAPFWADMIPDIFGDIFYRVVSDRDTLNDVEYEIDRLTKSSCGFLFKPSWAAVITWHQLKAFNHRRFEYNNTFQLVLTSNGHESYVIFNYGRLQWPNSRVKVNVEAGFNFGDGKTYYQMNGSFSQNITEVERKSNVGIRSKWLFRVDQFENAFERKNEPRKVLLRAHCLEEKKLNLAFSVLLLITSLYMLVSVTYSAWNYIKKQRLRPRLQMSYNKQLNDSTMALSQDI